MLKEKIDNLLRQPMTRREFLRNVGLLIVAFFGIPSALSILSTGQTTQIKSQIVREHRGFGGGKFGV